MKIKLIWVGKTKNQAYIDLIALYIKRLRHHANVQIVETRDRKGGKKTNQDISKKECVDILRQIDEKDYVILLDEKGKGISSVQLASFIEKKVTSSSRTLTFIVGGAYGAHEDLFERADYLLSLSKMTFTHDMCRVILTEQIYRAWTIIRGEKYHH